VSAVSRRRLAAQFPTRPTLEVQGRFIRVAKTSATLINYMHT
jgi:hypothetical protein